MMRRARPVYSSSRVEKTPHAGRHNPWARQKAGTADDYIDAESGRRFNNTRLNKSAATGDQRGFVMGDRGDWAEVLNFA